MDLAHTEQQQALREEARAWLRANVPDEPLASMDSPEGFEQHRDWERRLHEGGWGQVSWPEEYGGRGLDLVEWLIFEEEYYHAGAPARVNQNGIFLLGPTLMEHGTADQQDRFLPAMAAGEEIWCQGFSEPEAGSDLASIRSRAVRDGDQWVLDGHKTWTSRGAFADWMFGIFRSDPDTERHRGLVFLLVPLDADGVEVRPIRQLDGHTGFAEIFLDGVRVDAERCTVGRAGDGWGVAMSTVGFERGVSLRSPGRFTAAAEDLIGLWEDTDDPPDRLRDEVVEAWMNAQAYDLYTHRTVSRVRAGGDVGPESSANKLFWSEMDIHLRGTALRLLGGRAPLTGDAPAAVDGGRWLDDHLFALAGPIYAGTNQIQRNIIAERVLDLPRHR